MQARILVVEDDAKLQALFVAVLRKEGFSVALVSTGEDAFEQLDVGAFDLVVIDPLLAGLRLPALRRLLRRSKQAGAAVMAVKSGQQADAVLKSLGEDRKRRIAATVEPSRFIGRVKEQLRESKRFRIADLEAARRRQHPLVFGNVSVDTSTRAVWRNGAEAYLRPKEFELLCFLLGRAGKVCSRHEIMRHVWGPNHPSAPKAVDVTMRSLRQKVEEDPSNPQHLLTERGKGYMFAG